MAKQPKPDQEPSNPPTSSTSAGSTDVERERASFVQEGETIQVPTDGTPAFGTATGDGSGVDLPLIVDNTARLGTEPGHERKALDEPRTRPRQTGESAIGPLGPLLDVPPAAPTQPAPASAPVIAEPASDPDTAPAKPLDAGPPRGTLRYQVHEHGSLLRNGKTHKANTFLDLNPHHPDTVELVRRGTLKLAQRLAGRACATCGDGTGATVPCSVECFVAAGYPAEEFDGWIERAKAYQAEREATAASAPASKP